MIDRLIALLKFSHCVVSDLLALVWAFALVIITLSQTNPIENRKS